VARNAEFQALAKDIAMQIAASDPKFIRREDVTADVLASERDICRAQARATGRPENVLDKIVEGRMTKFSRKPASMEQPFVRIPPFP